MPLKLLLMERWSIIQKLIATTMATMAVIVDTAIVLSIIVPATKILRT